MRFWVLLAAIVAPATVLIGQQWLLGARLATLEVHERDSRVRRAVDGFVDEALRTYRRENRFIYEQLCQPIDVTDVLGGGVPASFRRLRDVVDELGRPPVVFTAVPERGGFRLRYYALDESDAFTAFPPGADEDVQASHQAVLTYLHGTLGNNEALQRQLRRGPFCATSEYSPIGVLHFFHHPLYRDNPVIPQVYVGFWEPVEFAYERCLAPFVRDGALARRLKDEGFDPGAFRVTIDTIDGRTLYASAPPGQAHDVLAARFAGYGELFQPLVLRVGVLDRGVTAVGAVRKQNVWLLGVAALMVALAATLLARSMLQDRRLVGLQSDFVSRVGHELKTPMAVLLNAAESLENPKLQNPDDARRCTRIVRARAIELARLLERMIDLGRIESDRGSARAVPVDVAVYLRESIPRLCASVDLPLSRVSVSADTPAVALADEAVLDVTLRNLLDNVVKYAGDCGGKPVDVGCDVTDRWVVLTVRDHGVGIPANARRYVFRRFYRVSRGLREDAPGHGLGLALVKSLVEAYGGRVAVDATAGGGATFTVRFPRKDT
ncbi:MAG: sensor histidine kinase [Phycisphaerae bacterium]